ncbi:MAG: UPF0489 family protein [Clostridia bacterium]|nr:UPF0489 family protein [Clostridia bacterium]
MKVLDLDMDFFLSGPCPLAAKGERPAADACTVWTPEAVRAFLEDRCGLSREHPVPGAVFETHDGALDFWQKQISAGKLQPPFECVHVDTHSDLAFGPPGPDFVLKAVISRKPGSRNTTAAYREGKKLDEANYLLFAAGYRWFSALTYVRNPRSLHDVPGRLLDEAGNLFLRSEVSALMEGINGLEPVIPFRQVDDYRTFKDSGFSFATMAQSPRYAPAKADFILDIFREYIKEE